MGSLSDNVKKRMDELKLNQRDVAEILKVHPNTASSWVNKPEKLPETKLTMLAEALQTTVSILRYGYEPKSPERVLSEASQDYETAKSISVAVKEGLQQQVASKDNEIKTLMGYINELKQDKARLLKENARLQEKLDQLEQNK